jgi:hypothetical protein
MRCSRLLAESVEFGDHELVSRTASDQQGLVQFGAAGEFAGRLVDEDLFASGSGEGVDRPSAGP